MSVRTPRVHVALSQAIARLAAVLCAALGAAGMMGWIIGSARLTAFLHDHHIGMNPMTAICFMCAGASLWMAREPATPSAARNKVRVGFAGVIIAITTLKLLDLAPGAALHIDALLFFEQLGKNRMAPNTVAGLMLAGWSLALLDRPPVGRLRVSTTLALLTATIALLALTGHLYGVQVMYGLPKYIAMAINTAAGLIVLSVGILCIRPMRQPIAVLVSPTAGGVVARRLVPVAVAVPLLLGWVRLRAERLGLFESGVGVMLFALALVAVFLTIIWWIARALYKLDIQRARAEAAFADNFQLMRTLIDHLPDRIFAKDSDSRFLINNAAHIRVLGGRSPEDVQGKRDEDFWPAQEARKFRDEEQQVIESGEALIDQEQRRTSRTGEERWVTVTKVPFRNAAGVVAGIVGITHDITAMKQAQSMLREQNEMLEQAVKSEHEAHEALKKAQSQLVQSEKLASLGQMVAGVAHEINNPLSFVANNVVVLQRDLKAMGQLIELYQQADASIASGQKALADEIRDFAERVDLAYTLPNLQDLLARSREGLRRIQQIVRDLRDFARLDESDLHEVDLNEGIRSTVNIIHGLAKKQQVKVELELGTIPSVSCFPAKINQVVMNLLSNAIQASPPHSTVEVRTRRTQGDGDAVVIEIEDHGAGIPAGIRDRIFDPFFTTKPSGEGTGLGLSISYGIVQDHGGRIDLQSEEGKGTRFTVTIPTHPPTW